MSRWGKLIPLVRTGASLMVVGNALVTSLGFVDSRWKYFVYIFPANLGQGIVYPGILFTSLATFDHAGELYTASLWGLHQGADGGSRPCSFCVDDVSRTVSRNCVWRGGHICHCADDAQCPLAAGPGRYPRQAKGEESRERKTLDADSIPLQLVEEIRHSVSVIKTLPPDIQLKARMVYYDGLRYSFATSTAFAVLAVVAVLFANGRGLRSTS